MNEAKRRFILVDQSVKEPGGHHYEYAQRILDAARNLGYETVLLAHKDYRGAVDHNVRPTFSMTFWDNYRHYYAGASRPRLEGMLARSYRAPGWVRALLLEGKRRFLFSRLGLALTRARHLSLRDIVLKPHLDDDFSLIRSGRLSLGLCWALSRSTRLATRVGRWVNQRLKLRQVLIFVAAVVSVPVALPAVALLWLARRDPARTFVAEFCKAAEVRTQQDSLIFVPNATAAELEALALLTRRRHPSSGAHWAFLFRRPVFSGYPGSYSKQAEAVRRHRMELAHLKLAAPDAKARFYTDTDELTEQYELLGVYPFETLPVPVDPVAARPACPTPLAIGYLGDARDEKGFQHLPELVEAFLPRDGVPSPVRFVFQSNFNVPGGEPGSRYARGLLEEYDSRFVELIEGPFDSAEYAALLARMDIVLIPYGAENYSARSSGVFVEALAAGLPVLAPSCSWMARLAEPLRQGHLRTLFDHHRAVAVTRSTLRELAREPISIRKNSSHVLLRMKFGDEFNGFVRVALTGLNEFDLPVGTVRQSYRVAGGETLAAFEVPAGVRMRCTIETMRDGAEVGDVDTEVGFFVLPRRVPLEAGVALFDGPHDLISAVRSLVEFYEHQRSSAQLLRDQLKPLSDPAVLISRLAENAFGSHRAEMTRRTPSEGNSMPSAVQELGDGT